MAIKINGNTAIDDSKNACLNNINMGSGSSIIFPDSSKQKSAYPGTCVCNCIQGTANGAVGLCCFIVPAGISTLKFYAVGGGGCGCCYAYAPIWSSYIHYGGSGGSAAWGCLNVSSGCTICTCYCCGCAQIIYNGNIIAITCPGQGIVPGCACICSSLMICGGTACGGAGGGYSGGASAGSVLGNGYCGGYGGAGFGGCGYYGGGGIGSASAACIEGKSGGAGPNQLGRVQYDYTGARDYFTDPLLCVAREEGIAGACCNAAWPSACCFCGSNGNWGVGGQALQMCTSCCFTLCVTAGNGGPFAGGGSASGGTGGGGYVWLRGGNGGWGGGGGGAYPTSSYSGHCLYYFYGGCGGCGGGSGGYYVSATCAMGSGVKGNPGDPSVWFVLF